MQQPPARCAARPPVGCAGGGFQSVRDSAGRQRRPQPECMHAERCLITTQLHKARVSLASRVAASSFVRSSPVSDSEAVRKELNSALTASSCNGDVERVLDQKGRASQSKGMHHRPGGFKGGGSRKSPLVKSGARCQRRPDNTYTPTLASEDVASRRACSSSAAAPSSERCALRPARACGTGDPSQPRQSS